MGVVMFCPQHHEFIGHCALFVGNGGLDYAANSEKGHCSLQSDGVSGMLSENNSLEVGSWRCLPPSKEWNVIVCHVGLWNSDIYYGVFHIR